MLLRPKTALKDMFLEVNPGTGKPLPEGGRISVANSLPDIDPDEVYSALDADTRPYLKLLVSGAGKGLRGRGDDLREVFRRLEPIHKDLARVTRASARRRGALKELIHDYGLLMTEVGNHPQELRRLVTASRTVFDALANEDDAISASVAQLPASLRATEDALGKVREFSPVLRSSLESLREPIRKLPATNEAVIPFLRETQPVIRDEIRPFVRAARPWTDDLRLAAEGHGEGHARPAATRSASSTASSTSAPSTRAAPRASTGSRSPSSAQRQEGYLYWLAWVSQNGSLAVLDRRRPGSVAPRHDLRRPGGGPHGDRGGRDRRRGRAQPRARRPAHDPGSRRQQRRRPAAGHPVRLLQLQRPAPDAASGQRRRRPRSCRFPSDPTTPAMNKNPPSLGRIAAMVGFTLSVAALLMFLWTAFGGTLPLRPESYRFKANFPEASLLVQEADVRMAGVNIGKVKAKELGPGGRTTTVEIELDDRFAPIGRDARAILRQKSLLGETYVELTPGSPGAESLDDGGTLPARERGRHGRARRGLPRVRSQDPRRLPAVAARGGDSHDRDAGRATSTTRSGNAAPFFEGGADLLRPLAEQEVALRQVFRDTGRVFNAVSREDGQLRGLITGGDATFGALASRDDALAETFAVFPTFLRETRTTVRRLEDFARNTDPLVRDLASRRRTWRRRCATWATSRPTWRSSSGTSTRWCGHRTPACRRPSAS